MSHQLEALAIALAADLPVALRGRPGVGKTSMIMQAAQALGLHPEVVIGSTRDPADLVGLPLVSEGGVRIVPPNWAVKANACTDGAVIFLDELTTMAPMNQAACFRIILERVVGDLPLGAHVRVAAAYNDAADCDGYELSLPMRSRLCHLEVAANVDTFTAGLAGGWPEVPLIDGQVDASNDRQRWEAIVAGFIRAQPDLLDKTPPVGSSGGYATPRSWVAAARGAGAADACGASTDARSLLIAGCVGVGAAIELLAYAADLDLPDPREILRDPDGTDLLLDPHRPDRVFVILSSVVRTAITSNDPEWWEAAFGVLGRATKAGFGDIAAWVCRPLVSRRPDGAELPANFAELRDFLAVIP